MRKFASVPPRIWQADLKSVRGNLEAIAVHYHLTTSGHATMLGLYYLPIPYLAHEIGCTHEGASEGLRSLIDGGICSYDSERELVWVHEMAADQIAPQLSPKDKRVKGIADQLMLMPICPITLDFYRKYRSVFHLNGERNLAEFERAIDSPFEGPSMPLGSKEKEKEKDKEKDLGEGTGQTGLGKEVKEGTYTREAGEQDQPKAVTSPSPSGGATSPAPKQNPYLAAKDGGAISREPFSVPKSHDAGRSFLRSQHVPESEWPRLLSDLMDGRLYPFDIEPWTNAA